MTAPRRWSFSLRTLFVVVTIASIVSGWVAYQLNWIWEREEARRGGLALNKLGFYDNAPWHLRMLGEYGVEMIFVEKARADHAHRLFPEAEIVVVDR